MEKEFRDFIKELKGEYKIFFIQNSVSRNWKAEYQGEKEGTFKFGAIDHHEIFDLADMCIAKGFNTLLMRK